MTTTPDLDLNIISITDRESSGGTWVKGTIDDQYRFDALVFAEHAESEDYELNRSRISKLWIRDMAANTLPVHNLSRKSSLLMISATTAMTVVYRFFAPSGLSAEECLAELCCKRVAV